MKTSYLILGGARSGKSRRALTLAAPFREKMFVATAEPRDAEMRARILRHQAERGPSWRTIEEPVDLIGALKGADAPERVIVVDCLTLWLSNLMERGTSVKMELERLTKFIPSAKATLIFVSNELGLGLVPETELGRVFRDTQGRVNQSLAARVERVELIVAGLPLQLKA